MFEKHNIRLLKLLILVMGGLPYSQNKHPSEVMAAVERNREKM